jgi:hypothetical protein
MNYSMTEQVAPQVDRGLLARAALSAGIPLNAIDAEDTPWQTTLPKERAALWAAALAELDPVTAEAMHALHSPISMGLAMALDGEVAFTPELIAELQSKRPETYRAQQLEAIDQTLEVMKRDAEERRAAQLAAANANAALDAQLRAQSREMARLALLSNANSPQW